MIELAKHASQPFNPDLANVFFRAGLIESWGRGIERINKACADEGVGQPEISCDVNGLWITFHFLPEHRNSALSAANIGEKLGEKLGENRLAIVHAMVEDPAISISTLAQRLGLSSTAIENNVKWLKEHGYIQRVGPAKGGHWQVVEQGGEL
ncbi:winged helix-turn-helix transcriptional regulator [Mariprofundus erugo]|uniref:ATP-binding protein n=1 Tax=Mariprofundus erugo TaxID=2528639 RepID=UPI0010FF3224|nr:ATP-binding protein [Mariprofundus erugo]TLS78363.1 winged helix-turn-helix transcriptional regulator [Mariprofundus erugo]